ncbi:MAG: hypothetical protein RO257_15410 [Candidatus Kapabacteria bacterium]|nr:hypothetical protein [Candidatus Kapabacteria bacterium]
MNNSKYLLASKAKVERAIFNINYLESEFKNYNESKPYELKNELDPSTNDIILVYYPLQPIPTNWSVIIGEIIFNLRSALDIAVFEMTVNENGSNLKGTEFPIFEDRNIFYEVKKDGQYTNRSGIYKIRGLNDKSKQIIESIQPFNILNNEETSILSLLHEMNITDKHKQLHLCRCLATSTKVIITKDICDMIDWSMSVGTKLDQRAIISRLHLKNIHDNIDFLTANIDISIEFDKTCSLNFKKSEKVIYILNSFEKCVQQILYLLENSNI